MGMLGTGLETTEIGNQYDIYLEMHASFDGPPAHLMSDLL